MGFTNVLFLFFFFPFSVGIYYFSFWLEKKIFIFKKNRISDWSIILISLFFYAWALAIDVLKLVICSIFLYFMGRCIKIVKKKYQKIILIVSLFLIILSLFIYKYLGVFSDNFATNLVAPLGWSFIVFSFVSYIVDIYRKEDMKVGFIDSMLYFTFFPKIVSGPIVLWKDFSNQIKNRKYSTDKFLNGINLIIIGFAKKVILADSFGAIVFMIREWMGSGIDVLTAIGLVILYSLQIYYDFSGYSDIAIGLSKIFGFEFSNNFNYPYTAFSITDFWRRWHISLGNWFKEYVYIPLGGNRKGKRRTLCNIFIVFLLTGIWHGAGWNYIIWGLLHGVLRMSEKLLENKKVYQIIPRFIKHVFIIVFVFFGWEFFMFSDLKSVIDFNKIIFGVTKFARIQLSYKYFFDFQTLFFIIVAIIGSFFGSIKYIQKIKSIMTNKRLYFIVKEIVLFILFFITIMFMINSKYSPFIYFQY